MIKKGEEVLSEVLELNSEGKGVSKLEDGFVIFSTGTLPGDQALIKITRKKSSYAEAKLIEIKRKSPFRIEPECYYFGVCGGCKIQNLDYDKQIEFKTNVVRNAFERIGGFKNLTVPYAIKSSEIFFYRNKMEFSFSDDEWMTIPPDLTLQGRSVEFKSLRNDQDLIPPNPSLQGGNKPSFQEDNIESKSLRNDQDLIPPDPPLQGGNKNSSEESSNLPYEGGQGELSPTEASQWDWKFDSKWLKDRGLILGGYHLPYNPKLIPRAKELRKNLTEAEKKIWYQFLRKHWLRFLRQRPIDNYIVDFYCSAVRLIVEIDGEQHLNEDSKIYDSERTTILEETYGLKVLRFSNTDVVNNFEKVCEEIEKVIEERKSLIPPDPTLQGGNVEFKSSGKEQDIIPPNPPLQGGNKNSSEESSNPPYEGGQGGLSQNEARQLNWKNDSKLYIESSNNSSKESNSTNSKEPSNPPYEGGQGGLSPTKDRQLDWKYDSKLYKESSNSPNEGRRAGFALGLHVPKFHSKIINIEKCFLQSEISNDILNFTRQFFKNRNVSVYSTKTQNGFLRFLIIRQSKNTNDLMVNLITYDYHSELMKEYSEQLKFNFTGITTIINSISQKKAQVATGESQYILLGDGFINEKLKAESGKEIIFKVSPQSFFQTNTLQAEKLFNVLVEFGEFKKSDTVLDLYCGAGSISIFISDLVGKVLGVELINDAIRDAKINAKLNNIENVEFVCSDIKDYLENQNVISQYNKLILDPPRSGLHPKICEILSGTNFEKIIYVSCNPHTQARDLQIICGKENYAIEKIQPVDMFPHTYHVENVVSLFKK